MRDAVPARHRVAFDELLGEARTTYRLRDERGTYADLWAIGIMRRAILSAGRRLAAIGRLSIRRILLRQATRSCEVWSSPATVLRARSWPSVRATGWRLGTRMRRRFLAASLATHCLPSGCRPPRRGWNARWEPPCRPSSPRRSHARRGGRCVAWASVGPCTRAPHG